MTKSELSTTLADGRSHRTWLQTIRYHKPNAVQIAEYWRDSRWLAVWRRPDGMGFDIGYSDALRDGVGNAFAKRQVELQRTCMSAG